MRLVDIKNRILVSRLFRDSFWAVFGNGLGNALLLLSGIVIARFLGKEIYGEYGIVKTTMLYIASFATLGLGFTSTKYVANAFQDSKQYVRSIVRDILTLSLLFSCLIALLLIIFSHQLSSFLNEPTLVKPFRYLAAIIVFRALTTTQIGILSGFKDFKSIAYNSLLSGVFLLIICIPFTYFLGLKGSLISLLLSQMFNVAINFYSVHNCLILLINQQYKGYKKELFLFSLPVALQESSFTICHWTAIMLLTKYSSMGEVGLYTASAQWNSIILMIPLLLNNVVLSYLSGSISNSNEHGKILQRMLIVNMICSIVPFCFIYILADFISSFYGSTFIGMATLLRIVTFSTIFESGSSVFKSELLSQSKTWGLFFVRLSRDVLLVSLTYFYLKNCNGQNGAIIYSWILVSVSVFFFIALYLYNKFSNCICI